ncbi:MAG: glycosyltransferase family 1 protein [Acidobacteria bacterium]|nr:MAG: glycosyltransferase family 1 protein [Acidobacteriota bacterium]REK04340.1 MAG: glycosyltransferase family 1 protein [Acidobacteriota bacterium]
MKIAIIAAGAGGMFCGSCIRDNALATELMAEGHDVVLLPIYTPMRTDEEGVALDHVFYGAVSIYLEQKFPWFARIPRWMRGWLDHPALLRRLPMSSNATNAKDLGELTLSTLRGEEGRQRAELEHMARWLADHYQPEVIQLSNSMLLGFVRELRRHLPDARIVCALQGEDIFLDDLDEPYRTEVIGMMGERARECDLFVSTSVFYAAPMAELLGIDRDRIVPTRIGIHVPADDPERQPPPEEPFTIGYLARICPEKGLHRLVDAFELLCERIGAERLRLRVAGYESGRDRQYSAALRQRLERSGLSGRVDWLGEVDREQKTAFLRSLHVFSVPTIYHDPKGLPVLEAMAEAVPVVQPRHGAFPELLERTGGGVLVEPDDARALADAIERLLRSPEERDELGRQGAAGVRREFTTETMAEDTLRAYRRALSSASAVDSVDSVASDDGRAGAAAGAG